MFFKSNEQLFEPSFFCDFCQCSCAGIQRTDICHVMCQLSCHVPTSNERCVKTESLIAVTHSTASMDARPFRLGQEMARVLLPLNIPRQDIRAALIKLQHGIKTHLGPPAYTEWRHRPHRWQTAAKAYISLCLWSTGTWIGNKHHGTANPYAPLMPLAECIYRHADTLTHGNQKHIHLRRCVRETHGSQETK